MRHAHIAFINSPYYPHVNPTISIVATLVRRGYRVSYLTSDGFSTCITEVGAEVLLAEHQGRNTGDSSNLWVSRATEELSSIKTFYEDNRPDLIVYDFMSLAGRILANNLRIPAIMTSPAFGDHWERYQRVEHELHFREIDCFLGDQGVATGNPHCHKEELNIFFYPKEFQPDVSSFEDGCFYAGRCAGERPYKRTWKPPQDAGTRPLVLVTTSTAYVQGPEYFRMCIDALEGLQWHVVLAIGFNNDPSSFGPLPPDFEILQYVPQIQVLPYSDLLICLGGMVTTVEAAYYGVPMILITHGLPEPELYAENIVRLGLGVHLKGANCCSDAVRQAVLHISQDSDMLDRVKGMQHTVRRNAGGEETANRIIEYLESRTVPYGRSGGDLAT